MLRPRDRHQRGIRGRLAWPNPYTGAPAPLRGRTRKGEFFVVCVHDALAQISEHCPRALAAIDVGIEDVPTVTPEWVSRVPLAAAVSPTPDRNGQVVVFRRPLERRARTRTGLRILVFRTIVEQVAEATGIPVDEIDPKGHRGDDEWE